LGTHFAYTFDTNLVEVGVTNLLSQHRSQPGFVKLGDSHQGEGLILCLLIRDGGDGRKDFTLADVVVGRGINTLCKGKHPVAGGGDGSSLGVNDSLFSFHASGGGTVGIRIRNPKEYEKTIGEGGG
jgi:hypothetical protein